VRNAGADGVLPPEKKGSLLMPHGATLDCKGCRFWSELIARADRSGQIEAICLSRTGQKAGEHTTGGSFCEGWKSGHLGSIDDPDLDRLRYADEIGQAA
jgi:hypothetical protein